MTMINLIYVYGASLILSIVLFFGLISFWGKRSEKKLKADIKNNFSNEALKEYPFKYRNIKEE